MVGSLRSIIIDVAKVSMMSKTFDDTYELIEPMPTYNFQWPPDRKDPKILVRVYENDSFKSLMLDVTPKWTVTRKTKKG